MHHLILFTALLLYAIVLLLVLRRFGLGLIQTLVSGVVTIAFVWGALHLVYASDALYDVGLVAIPASVAAEAVPYAWLWRYVAWNGWILGIACYVPVWFAAAFMRALRQQRESMQPSGLT